jgi:cation diffusion facilitator family transporter
VIRSILIKLIIRKWIKDHENVTDKRVREAYVVLSGTVGMLCNLLLFVTKLSVGLLINSIAVISDAFNNLTDMGSSLVSVLSAKLSNRPPDEGHPHGHGRFEYIGSLVVAFIIFSVGYQLLLNSYNKFINPEKVTFSSVTLVILILSVLVKLWMFSYNLFIAKKIKSSINKATAYDSINDSIATSLVIVAIVIGTFTDFPVDGAAGVVISLLILYSGFDIARDTVSLLLGSAPDPEVVERINQIVKSGKHVIGIHELEIHDYGPGRISASIHVEVPDYLNIVEGHASIDVLENQIVEELGIDMIVHMDPISTNINKIEKVKKDVNACVAEAGIKIEILNFRIAQAEKKVIVIFDVEVAAGIPESKYGQIKKIIREKIEEKYEGYEVVINRVNRSNGQMEANARK